jgi:ligand-binding sensor domain-containing protein/signal transduction histidine kinase/DNA-binding response OmpR family regulator
MHGRRKNLFLVLKWILILSLLIVHTSVRNCFAQPAFTHLTIENGLSHNSVLAITQDSRGFMWYGTVIGLNRYDGHHFKIYKTDRLNKSSLSNNNVLSLLSDSRHNLWIGTALGLNKYDTLHDAFLQILFNQADSSSQANNIQCLYEDKKGNLWIGTGNGAYLLTNKQKNASVSLNISVPPTILAGNAVRCFYQDHNGVFWIGTNNGLTKVTMAGGTYRYEKFTFDASNPGSISANYVTSIMEDQRGNLWVGTQNSGINLFNSLTKSFRHFCYNSSNPNGIINNNIRIIISDKSGRLWIGTQEGLSIMDTATEKMKSFKHDAGDKRSLSQNSVYSLYEDNSGTIWAGTYFGGINAMFPFTTSFTVLQNNESRSSINNNVISSIVEDEKHNLWIGTEGGGLNYYNRTSGLFTAYTSKSNNSSTPGSNLIKVVYRDRDGNTWAGTHGGGLNLFDAKTNTFTRYLYKDNDAGTLNAEIVALMEDSKKRFWVATNTGLKLFLRDKKKLIPCGDLSLVNQVSNKMARSLLEDSQKRIWICTDNGLYLLENDSLKLISEDYINCITEDGKGNIWAGLYYGGLARYNPIKHALEYYTGKDGLPASNVMGILEDHQNNLWLSTDNGLIRFDVTHGSFRIYTVSDGLPDNAFNYNSFMQDSRGEFFFGGYNGLTSFFPANIEINNFTAPLVFTGLKLFNEPVDVNGKDHLLMQDIGDTHKISFNHHQNVFTIDYALLNFIKSAKNKYAYTLEAFDKGWNEVNTTSVTYTNLPAGKYTLLVKGANNDGKWSAPAAMQIIILPPFWLTWWAYLIYLVIFGAIFFVVTRFIFLQALLKKEDALHQVKLNFFTNISHDIRTHLSLIMIPLEKISDTKDLSEVSRHQLNNIKKNADRLLKLVSELMDFRKAETHHLQLHVENHDLVAFLQQVYISFTEVSIIRNINLSFLHESKRIPLYFDGEQLSKVFYNLLFNAFKFTQAGGLIIITVMEKEHAIQICIEDNGRGIAPEHLQNLFTNFFQVADQGIQNTGYGIGLALSKNILELHKGHITVTSEPAHGDKESKTCFIVTLLKGKSHFEQSSLVAGDSITGVPAAMVPEEQAVALSPAYHGDEQGEQVYTILIVEDNAELRSLVAESFNKSYRLIACEEGNEGWQVAAAQLPDLIISDVMMPGMNGFKLCQKLKMDTRTSHIPVILLTAKSSQADQINGLETGADIYITKPFSPKVLTLNVRNLLASRERQRLRFSQQIIAETVEEVIAPQQAIGRHEMINAVDGEFMNNVITLVEKHMDDPEFGVDMLARKVAMSQPVLYKKLKAVTNMSVNDFVKTLRLKKAAQLLKQQEFTVYEVAYAVGYNDRKYFSREFKKQFGKTPSEYA